MTQGIVYMVEAGGALRRMAPSSSASEDQMQALVAARFEATSVSQMMVSTAST